MGGRTSWKAHHLFFASNEQCYLGIWSLVTSEILSSRCEQGTDITCTLNELQWAEQAFVDLARGLNIRIIGFFACMHAGKSKLLLDLMAPLNVTQLHICTSTAQALHSNATTK